MRDLVQRFIIVVFLGFVIYSCNSKTKSSDIINPNDTTSTSYIPPQTVFVSVPITGNVITTSSVRVSWRGSKDVQSFSYKLDSYDWTTFSADTFLVIEDLDEGDHLFSVRSKHANGTIETSPKIISFVVDAVKGPAVMFGVRKKVVNVGQVFSYSVNVEEVQNILGMKATISFDKQLVTISSIDLGSYASSNNVKPSLFENTDNVNGKVRIDILFAGGSPKKGIAGSGDVITLNCKANAIGTANFIFIQDSTWYRDTTNTTITLKEFVVGKVVVK
jgi:hypothetical protein